MAAIYTKGAGARPGFVLIATTILTALLLTLGTFFVSTATTDLRIAVNHGLSVRAYYLTEAAVGDFIARLRNDSTLFDAFIQGTLSPTSLSITRNAVFSAGDSYAVYGQSTAPALAELYATATVAAYHAPVVRRIRFSITRATGTPTAQWPLSLAAGGVDVPGRKRGGIDVDRVTLNVDGATLHANRDFTVHNRTTVLVNRGNVNASRRINVQNQGTLTITNGTRQEGVPQIEMPMIDFDSDLPTSWKSRATQIFTSREFDRLPSGTVLTGIIFVNDSPRDLQKDLEVRGTLVVNGDFEIEPPAHLSIRNHPLGSGLLIKRSLEIESAIDVHGLVYAGKWLGIDRDHESTAPFDTIVVGGMVGPSYKIHPPIGSTVTIHYNRNAVSTPLQGALNQDAPLIDVNHWEEQY